ncbi:MAG: lysyl-tRNA synthetase, class [Actinomycetota bacterium]|nr:lysyl-tRNA synthetase, class [Actinomycetota bacterium]
MIVAWVVRFSAVIAVLDILSPLEGRPRHHAHYSLAINGVVAGTAFAGAVFAAGAMLVLAGALRRRKRGAWVLTVGAVSVSLVMHLPLHHHLVALLNLAVLTLLITARRDFTATSEPAGRLLALRVLLVMLTVSITAGLLLAARLAPTSSFGTRLQEVLAGLVGFTPELEFRREYGSTFLMIGLNTLGALTAMLTLGALLAPARQPIRLSNAVELRVRGLLETFGTRDSLGYFALRRDKTVIFSPSHKAAVAYRVVDSVTLASGDPLGDPEAWPGAIQAWLDEADAYAWTPGVLAASEEGAIAYHRAGLDSLELGDEAVLDLSTFSLEGRTMRVVRQAVNRVSRAGYTLDLTRQNQLAPDELAELEFAADVLRGDEVERGFSMALGRLGDPRDPDLLIARARDGDGRLIAVLTFVPWGPDGLSLDIMRRSRGTENGTVEFVVTGVAEQARDLGIRRISLNFAVFRSVFERGSRVGAGPALRLWYKVLLLASRWWQLESLYRANAKYQPLWVPRFICFRRAVDLPRVVIAIAEAEAFIQRPRLRWLKERS